MRESAVVKEMTRRPSAQAPWAGKGLPDEKLVPHPKTSSDGPRRHMSSGIRHAVAYSRSSRIYVGFASSCRRLCGSAGFWLFPALLQDCLFFTIA